MQKRFYTLILADDARGRIRRLKLPTYFVHLVLLAALVGTGTAVVGISSYAHLLLTLTDYSQVRLERERLREQNQVLQQTVATTQQRLTSLESLANEVAVSYDLLRLRQSSFGTLERVDAPASGPPAFGDTLARFRYLRRNAVAVKLFASGARPLPGQDLSKLTYTPSLWPVRGRLSSGFGRRVDPFSGEGARHFGVDISSEYGDPVRVAADGFVVAAGRRSGYGRAVMVEHGAGITTLYAHLSGIRAHLGQAVQRGDIIGYVGSEGRATAPHLHYEVRLNNKPLNPSRFLNRGTTYSAAAIPLNSGGGD